jgi:hypothetical protein
VSVAALISFISVYFYELPTHHCPFCILQGEYHYVGYLIYAAVLGGCLQRRVWVLSPAAPSRASRNPPRIRRLTAAALAFYSILAVVVIHRMVFGFHPGKLRVSEGARQRKSRPQRIGSLLICRCGRPRDRPGAGRGEPQPLQARPGVAVVAAHEIVLGEVDPASLFHVEGPGGRRLGQDRAEQVCSVAGFAAVLVLLVEVPWRLLTQRLSFTL